MAIRSERVVVQARGDYYIRCKAELIESLAIQWIIIFQEDIHVILGAYFTGCGGCWLII